MKKRDELIWEKMKKEGQSEIFIQDFLDRVLQVENGETGIVKWEEVGDLDPQKDEISFEEVVKQFSGDTNVLRNLVVIKLNGGLGTSMGLNKAKSLIPIKDGMSFLKVMASQIEFIRKKFGIEVPFLLMDSYNTQKDSAEELKAIGFSQKFPTSFLQHKAPRLKQSDLEPATFQNAFEEWCPPGHGDIWLAIYETGILDKLLESGYKVAFISNGDNLGATVHPAIVEYFLKENLDFAMEMTPKTLADKKGGAIYKKTVNGVVERYELLETAQVPKEHEKEFSGLGKFRTFSTNNLWINLQSLRDKISKGVMRLSLIVNPKVVESIPVYQLETAMGSAVGHFPKFRGIIIPRDRFAPVKKTEDYLVRRSDAYVLQDDFSLVMHEQRKKKNLDEVLVELDDNFYKKIQDFDALFPVVPSLQEAVEFKVTGKILFDVKVTIQGRVSFTNKSSETFKISQLGKTVFQNESVVV